VPDPLGPKNKKYFALWNYGCSFTPTELEEMKKIPRNDEVKLTDLQLFLLTVDWYNRVYLNSENDDPKIKQEIKRLYARGNTKHGVLFEDLRHMIVISETIRTKRYTCRKYGITVKAFEDNIKRHPPLQQLRKNLRKRIKEEEARNSRLVPVWTNNKLMLQIVKK